MERSFVVEFRYAGNLGPKFPAKFDVAEEGLDEQEFSYESFPIATRPAYRIRVPYLETNFQ